MGFPSGSVVTNLPAKVGDLGSVSRSGRSPGDGNDNPLQYSCLQNPTKESAYDAEDQGLIPGLGGSSGEGNGNPVQYYCLENPLSTEVWQTTVHGIAKSWT